MERVVGTSVMAEVVRGHNWRSTNLGPIEEWSETLVSQVNLMLHLPYAANLSWGDDPVFFYNDAAIETVGFRHPAAIGQSYKVLFAEVWQQIGSDFEDCLRLGKAAKKENVFVAFRRNEVVEIVIGTTS